MLPASGHGRPHVICHLPDESTVGRRLKVAWSRSPRITTGWGSEWCWVRSFRKKTRPNRSPMPFDWGWGRACEHDKAVRHRELSAARLDTNVVAPGANRTRHIQRMRVCAAHLAAGERVSRASSKSGPSADFQTWTRGIRISKRNGSARSGEWQRKRTAPRPIFRATLA